MAAGFRKRRFTETAETTETVEDAAAAAAAAVISDDDGVVLGQKPDLDPNLNFKTDDDDDSDNNDGDDDTSSIVAICRVSLKRSSCTIPTLTIMESSLSLPSDDDDDEEEEGPDEPEATKTPPMRTTITMATMSATNVEPFLLDNTE